MELKGLKVNFLGDSITEGVGTSSPDYIYHFRLGRECGFAEVRNYGISGTRIALQKGTPARPKDDYVDVNSFCERFSAMLDADLVVVFGGTNDYGHGDAPLGVNTDRTPETFYGACHTLFSGLKKKYSNRPIVIMTPIRRREETRVNAYGETVHLKTYVEILSAVADKYELPVLDLYHNSALQPEKEGFWENYIPDGLHPNDNGNDVIANELRAFLERL